MEPDYELSSSEEMDRRRDKAEEFFQAVLDSDEQPYFVSDEATLHDILIGTEVRVVDRCKAHYGVTLRKADFGIPVWNLLDMLENRRSR